MIRKLARALFTASFLAGCDRFGPDEGRAFSERVLRETPRLAQLAFDLPTAPRSRYNVDGSYPSWVGSVTFRRFEWRRADDHTYVAECVAVLTPGPGIAGPDAAPPAAGATLDLAVTFIVHRTQAPLPFIPSGYGLVPSVWRLRAVNGRPTQESGAVGDYRDP